VLPIASTGDDNVFATGLPLAVVLEQAKQKVSTNQGSRISLRTCGIHVTQFVQAFKYTMLNEHLSATIKSGPFADPGAR